MIVKNLARNLKLLNNAIVSKTAARSFSSSEKGYLSKIYDKHSITKSQKRITMAERIFRFAEMRANDPRWYGPGRIGREFRPRHAMLTMHLWFLQKRLINDTIDNHSSLLIQEEVFEIFWDDVQNRIREQGLAEMTVSKHLNDVQQYTFTHLTHYDHTFSEYANDPKKRYEELCGLVWMHVMLREENFCSDQVERIAMYIDAQYNNIMHELPEEYWREGRFAWVDLPDFSKMYGNDGHKLKEKPVNPEDVLPIGWNKALTNAGVPYYWNPDLVKAQWKRPAGL